MGQDNDFRPIAFLFFEAFFSFVNTKEKKAYSLPPAPGGTPHALAGRTPAAGGGASPAILPESV